MKTQELISKINGLGYGGYIAEIHDERVSVNTSDGKYVGNASTSIYGVLDTDTYCATVKPRIGIQVVLKYLLQYALTPLNEREDTKEYVVRMLPTGDHYLNQDRSDNHIFFSTKEETDMYKTHFTEKEYNEVKNKYSQWLPTFDTKDSHFVEVQDDQEW